MRWPQKNGDNTDLLIRLFKQVHLTFFSYFLQNEGKNTGREHSMPTAFLWANTLQEPTSSTFKLFPSKISLTAIFLTFNFLFLTFIFNFVYSDYYLCTPIPQFSSLLLLSSSTGSVGGYREQLYLELTSQKVYCLAPDTYYDKEA